MQEEIENYSSIIVEKVDKESQTVDRQNEKLQQINTKLKRALQIIKDKVQKVVNENPDLFHGISEETNERLDHLISIVEHQVNEISELKVECKKENEKQKEEIKELEK